MGLTRECLTDPHFSEQDKREIKVVIERYMENDAWAVQSTLPVGVLLTSHPQNRPYLKASLESHRKLGYWITLAYDRVREHASLPAEDVLALADTFVMPHYQTWGGCLYPYYWLLKFGVSAMQDFEYIYCANGDCIIEKPEGFPKLLAMMEGADIMTCGPDRENSVNTAGMIIKSGAFRDIVRHFGKYLIPFETYEKYTQDIGNTEGRFKKAIKDLGLKMRTVEPPVNEQLHTPGGTWYDIIGFRHIHAEHNWAYRNKGIPPDPKYFDERYMGSEIDTIKEYHRTKDRKVLESWWAK